VNLIWTPVNKALQDQISQQDQLLQVFVPFIQINALKNLVDSGVFNPTLQIVTRWMPNDILSGVSDLKIYPYLKEKGIRLYINNKIHLKLLIFESNKAFHTSGNITNTGLGLSENANIEIGCFVDINNYDVQQVTNIIEDSIVVTDEIYEIASQYLKDNKSKVPPLPKLNLVKQFKKEYSLSDFPAVDSPRQLFDLYSRPDLKTVENEMVRRCYHDLAKYSIPFGLDDAYFFNHVKKSFLAKKFVQDFIEELKMQKSMRFGLVTEWVHSKCTDVPLPYRSDIKKCIAHLYEWLSFFVDEITWDIPGKHSQVLYWSKS